MWTPGSAGARGLSFEAFLSRARPLPELGPCRAACCYLGAGHRDSGLCTVHYQAWRREGRPSGRAFTRWVASVRQPVNSRVLSLRGLPTLLRLELLYAIGCRAGEQVSIVTGGMRPWVDQLRAAGIGSVTAFDLGTLDGVEDAHHVRFARFSVDRVRLAYADEDDERRRDVWDLRLFGRPGRRRLDFTAIRQCWLREATKAWTATAVGRVTEQTLRHRVGSIAALSAVLAAGPGGGADPAALTRADIDRFLARIHDPGFRPSGRPLGEQARVAAVQECALLLREARDLGLLPTLGATFAFRRCDARRTTVSADAGRALPARVVDQLDAQLAVLADVPGCAGPARLATLGALGEQAGPMAVLAYRLLKGTGRRVGEIASLRLDCLDVDEYGKDVLVYDNHKAGRMSRRLPLADSGLVAAIRAQQQWVAGRFARTAREQLWLLPRPHKNVDGRHHLSANQLLAWTRAWVDRIPHLDAGPLDATGEPVPFDRAKVHPHAFRHTYAQTLADQGVEPSVLRDLMDHRSLTTTLGYYRVGDARKRAAMDTLARHTIDNRGVTRPVTGKPSQIARLNEQLSWVAVPMGKCSEPTNVRAGGQGCPIRYQCAGCPHFESDPSYLADLRSYADDLRRQREAMLAAGAADWATDGVSRQLDVIVEHVHTHEQRLAAMPADERAAIDDACATARKARRSTPVAFGTRQPSTGRGDNSNALRRARRHDSHTKRQRAVDAVHAAEQSGEPISFPAVARRAGVSVSFLYSDPQLAARIAAARDRQRQAGQQRSWQLPTRSLVTEPSLRAELGNAKEQTRQLTDEVTALRERLAHHLGAGADAARGRQMSPLLDELEQRAAELEADNHQLRQRAAQLQHELRELAETLDAARTTNRDLMAELNRDTEPRPAKGIAGQ